MFLKELLLPSPQLHGMENRREPLMETLILIGMMAHASTQEQDQINLIGWQE
jgi:hypothetical protein